MDISESVCNVFFFFPKPLKAPLNKKGSYFFQNLTLGYISTRKPFGFASK